MLNNIHLIIPMSGIGKRFIDAGYDAPKPLISVDGKPIIQHIVNLFLGISNITFICNKTHLSNTNMREILKTISPNARILEVPDNLKKGPVYTVSKIFDYINDDDEIIFSYCDYGTVWDFDEFIEDIKIRNLDGSIPSYIGFHPHMLGSDNYAFSKIENGLVSKIKEKEPFTNNKMNEYASNGTYYFKSGKLVKKYFNKLIENDIHINGEYYISLVYNLLIADGFRIGVFEIEKMLQWGTPYDLEIYNSWSNYFSNIIKPQKEIKHPPNTTLILPLAGRGSRFQEEKYELPKPLIDVDNLPMVVQAVNCLPKTDNIIFACLDNHIKNYNIDNILKNHYYNSEIISINEVTEGQACTCEIAIKNSKINLENPILISACDNGVYFNSNEYEKLLNDNTIDIIVWSFRNNQTSKINPNAYAWLDVDDDNFIKYVSCKNFIYDNPLETHAIIGTMFFRKGKYFVEGLTKNYEENIRTNGEFYVDDVLNQNIKSGLKVKVFEVNNYICWGTPNDYLTYNYWKDFFNNCIWHPYYDKKISYE